MNVTFTANNGTTYTADVIHELPGIMGGLDYAIQEIYDGGPIPRNAEGRIELTAEQAKQAYDLCWEFMEEHDGSEAWFDGAGLVSIRREPECYVALASFERIKEFFQFLANSEGMVL